MCLFWELNDEWGSQSGNVEIEWSCPVITIYSVKITFPLTSFCLFDACQCLRSSNVFPTHTCCSHYHLGVEVVNGCVNTVNTDIIFLCFSVLIHYFLNHRVTLFVSYTHSHTPKAASSQMSLFLTTKVQIEVMSPGHCWNCHLAFWSKLWREESTLLPVILSLSPLSAFSP